MTCQNLGVLCLLCSYVMTSVIGSHPADTKPRLVPPEIIEGPNFHEIFRENNDKKELPCKATGTPPIDYTWLFNGAEVNTSGEYIAMTDGHLHINNPTIQMEGYYQCLASNQAGVAMSNVTFLQAAVFQTLPARVRKRVRPLSVKPFDHVVLPCNHIIRSVPRDDVTWQLSTTDGEDDFREVHLGDQVTQAQDGSLVFSFVMKNNSAIYKCCSRNRINYQSSGGSKVNLIIEKEEEMSVMEKLNERPVLLYASSDVTVLEGRELRLQCLFGAWPVYEVSWKTPSGVTKVNRTLVVGNVSAADAGVYSCQARKILHDVLLSSPVKISVQVDAIPSFATSLRNQEVPESGRDVTFRCQGQGRPSPKVTWYTNGTFVDRLEDSLDHSISGDGPTSVLVLRKMRTSATVTCNISNTHGYRLQSASVTIAASESDADTISTSSSHDVIITSQMTSTDKQTSTGQYQMTTQMYPQDKSSTTSYPSSTTTMNVYGNNKNNTNSLTAPRVVENLLSSVTTTIIIPAAVGAVAVVTLVVIVVVVIIIVRIRRRSPRVSLPEQVQPLRLEEIRVRNEGNYDSDDSGYDDLKAEQERRALQGHQPS